MSATTSTWREAQARRERRPALAPLATRRSHDVDNVWDEGLSGASAVDVLAAAIRERRALVTLDLDFANPLRFPPSETPGIAVFRVRDRPGRDDLDLVVARLAAALATADLTGHLWIVERERVRQYEAPAD